MKEKILSWNEIYRAAEGKGFGDIELKVYNNARNYIENYALEHFGIDIKNEEIPEDAIDTFLSEHSELDRFTETGQMVAINTTREMENKTMNNETLSDKYKRMEKFFEGKYCNDFRKGDSFAQLYESVKKEFPNKTFPSWTDEKVLENAVSRIIYENIDFNLFSPDNYDVVYDVTDGYDQRCEISDKLAELLITNNIKFKDFNSLKDFLPNIEKPLLKEIKDNNPDMQVIDRINSAFNVASRLYPGIESAENKNIYIENKKTYIEKAFDSLKTDYEEKILNNELEFFELEALVKGLDAVRDGEKSLSYIRPNAEEMQIGSEEGWKFDEFTKGYALFQNSDSTLKGGVTPKFISKIDDMGVFESDGDAAVQWEKDTHGKLIQERESMWIGDEDLEYYSYPDTPENRAILKENGWLLEHPLKFDFSEFTENDFYKIKNELLKDRPNEDYYGRLHIGSIHVEFVINQPDGWVDTNYYILGEKGAGEAQFEVPYNYFPGNQFIANLFTENTYEEFKEKVSKAVLEDIATVGILKTEAMRPLVDWSDEKQCKELYRTKLVESARENEIVIAPYSQDRCDMEAVREFIADIDGEPASTIQDDVVMAVIDNIGKVQDSKEGDFLKLRKDGTMEHISALGHVEKEPLEILSIINSFAENHAAVSEDHSQQREDYEKINSLYKKAYEKHMRINDNGFNPSEYYAPKSEFPSIQPKEDLYSNVEAMSLSDESKNTMLSASFAGRGGLTQKAFAENGIEIDLETANALENCFSQIEAITKYTTDGHDLFNKGNGVDTISEHLIEYSEKDKVWFVHEKNWLAVSAIKGDDADPDDYMEKANRVGDRNWAISCEELVKYVYNEIKEDGEMEKEFPDTFKKLENLKDYTESLTEAKQLISDFGFEEYMSTPTFDNLKDVGLAYTTFEDSYTHEEYEVQASADLVNSKIITKVNDKIADVSEYDSLKEMVVNSLNNLDFDSLIYVPSSKIDEILKEEREDIEKILLKKADQIIAETFDEPSLAKKAKLYVPSDYGYDADNKIHILVEFDNNAEREEDLFNVLAERHLVLPNGIEVDFNPIKPDKSGTIEQYLESLDRIREENKAQQKRKEDFLANVKVTTENFREVFNEVSKLPKFKDKPLEAAGWCFSKVPKENKAAVGKWLSDLGCNTKKDSEKLFGKWNNENNPKLVINKPKNKSNEVDDWSISD